MAVLWRRHSARHTYKTGEHIIVENLKTEVGGKADTRVMTVIFDDEATVTKLEELRAYGGEIFLTGSLQIDFPEDVALELQPDQLRVLEVTGSTATLKYCPLDKAITKCLPSADRYLEGTV